MRFRHELRQGGWLSAAADARVQRAARQAVQAAVRFAQHSPDPDPATVAEGLFA